MIAIIYYQEITVIGVISIVLSLLSVSTKSLIFSTATTMNIFIFNWISIVTDFVGIFCSLSFVFYNYNSNYNSNSDENGLITQWGYIWIYESIATWGMIFVSLVCMVVPYLFWERWDYATRYNYSHWKEMLKTGMMVSLLCILFAGISFLFINIALFAVIAYVKCSGRVCLVVIFIQLLLIVLQLNILHPHNQICKYHYTTYYNI